MLATCVISSHSAWTIILENIYPIEPTKHPYNKPIQQATNNYLPNNNQTSMWIIDKYVSILRGSEGETDHKYDVSFW